MHMTNEEYGSYVNRIAPKSPMGKDVLLAFLVGGAICCLGQGIMQLFETAVSQEEAATWTSMTMVFIGALLTGLGVYDKVAKFAGGGTLVPITGFANAVVSPALEFKTEGFIMGLAAKMFTIAGPVIVYGTAAGVVYGVLYWAWGLL